MLPRGVSAALQSLMDAKPAAGQRVLVFAASGGVGHVAVQLAKSLGLFTVGVAGPKNTVRPAHRLGLQHQHNRLKCSAGHSMCRKGL
jgi:NADPH:quinone reductase-like Zn-dependent oxidoreductase